MKKTENILDNFNVESNEPKLDNIKKKVYERVELVNQLQHSENTESSEVTSNISDSECDTEYIPDTPSNASYSECDFEGVSSEEDKKTKKEEQTQAANILPLVRFKE